ncbi:MAG: pyridoxal-phosphate dependent enzyme [Actinomycetota bacterium]|nr:pyridoxal-phosphate dependent enzyme [Actinomycetota bacterium]
MSSEFLDKIKLKLSSMPRIILGSYPTPLQLLANMDPYTGSHRLLIKRDDMLGGNKVRKLEFFMAEAVDKKADTVITFGAEQSNHSRETAIACRRLGLEPVIIVSGSKQDQIQGNELLNHILGARMVYIKPLDPAPFTPGGPQTIGQMSEALKQNIPHELLGPGTYIIPVGGYTPLGSLGYVRGFLELYQQCREMKIRPDYVVAAAGTTGTLSGLVAGAALAVRAGYKPVKIIGISVTGNQSGAVKDIAERAEQTAALIGERVEINLQDIMVADDYWQPAYGRPSREGLEAIGVLAKRQGIFLDPVYTGKAMAGLFGLIREKEAGQQQQYSISA